ncbi:YajQ family cyclic di-GMP-binding protein [Vagococcus sp. PNs007]|uniref:Nucleotide-binding protein CBF31_01055 n=2 Tax=Vagococcus TaxID=2737 RepID=A0A430ABM7_9ENTE|nr:MULTISPECIES: YajQ family cyclic di-GMP-binding protein [Vagococcus]MDF0479912.1 YajQ family cyclic di-GMP-binding protein [Vagococcus proximus]RSU04637.1 YajQ family cyclic di-GMP-binding protein [Vagococcus fessus]
MAKDPSFDIISEINEEDVKNALQVATKEIKNRFDFKGSIASMSLENGKLLLVAEDDYKVEQVKDVLFSKLVKHNVPIKNIQFTDSEHALGGNARQYGDLVSGIDRDNSKKIIKAIKDSKLKVKATIQDEQIRVTGKSRDDLQAVIKLTRDLTLPIELQFTNFR